MAVDLLTLGIIVVASLFSFFIGISYLIRFISAYNKGEDIFKIRGKVINAFIFIVVVPFFIILIGTKLFTIIQPIPLVGITVSSGEYPSNERLSAPESIKITENVKTFDLTLNNVFNEKKEFIIELSCIDQVEKCNRAYDILLAEDKKVTVEPKISINLPISINIENTPKDDYLWMVKVKNTDNSTYDYIDVQISIK